MKRLILLLIVLFNLFLMVGFLNKNEKPMVQVEKSVSTTNKDLKTIDNQDTNLNNQIRVEQESRTNVEGSNNAQDIGEFIPDGWEILDIAEGDLNKDGINDKAFVIESSDEYRQQRNLLIVFGNKDDTYTLSIRAEKAILLSNEGGPFGDPFLDILIDRGSVLIKFMGGSSSRWNQHYRFRYQDNGWYLIGFTEGGHENIGDLRYYLQEDFNLITGDYIGNQLENGKLETIKKRMSKKQLLNLKVFVANEFSAYSLKAYLSNNIQDIKSFIPKGWNVLKEYGGELAIAEGDLNKDGINDKAFVIENSNEHEYGRQRNLLIVFGNKDDTYTLSIRAEKAILLSNEGGNWGYSFKDISIDRGAVLVKYKGGYDNIRHRYFRFMYQDNHWYLIGFTEGLLKVIGNSVHCLQDDFNLITGDYIGKKLDNGKIKIVEKNIGKKQLLNLKDFVVNEYYIQP
ncbi:hypothetical protein [Wukongibacter sp. M2B1]|uniref:hypothetical protein n=1 Tax=Wukongibacter sp. M2B1 TaxID=3088895 RepID=UPI003D7BF4B6